VIWSLVFLAILTTLTRTWRRTITAARSARRVLLLAVGAAFLAINWGVYVHAVLANQVVEASLGYFINPLVTVALGVVVLRERLRRAQWIAVAIAVVAVAVITVSYGRLPWISIVLAVTFGIYGLCKKQAGAGAVESLTIETAALLPPALIAVGWFLARGESALSTADPTTLVLLVLLGPITALPLLAFGGAATRIPLTTLGLMQYLTPIIQFLIGITLFGEAMPPLRWVGFALVWASLAVMTVDGLRAGRTGRVAEEVAVVEPD